MYDMRTQVAVIGYFPAALNVTRPISSEKRDYKNTVYAVRSTHFNAVGIAMHRLSSHYAA